VTGPSDQPFELPVLLTQLSQLARFFAIRLSSSFLSDDYRKADFSTYPWLTFGILGHI
jgi:hypothetical protein